MTQPEYHLGDLSDNAYVEMIGAIKQWVADANPEITERDYATIEDLYGSNFDKMAWDFLWCWVLFQRLG